MGIGHILISILLSAALLWILLRLFAKDEADLSLLRYPIFGAGYWFVGWMGTAAINLGIWILLPLAALTALAICQFFFVTMGKSLWLALVFVVVRTLLDLAVFALYFKLLGSG